MLDASLPGIFLALVFRVTQTTMKDSFEFVLHVPTQYDYRYRRFAQLPAAVRNDFDFCSSLI